MARKIKSPAPRSQRQGSDVFAKIRALTNWVDELHMCIKGVELHIKTVSDNLDIVKNTLLKRIDGAHDHCTDLTRRVTNLDQDQEILGNQIKGLRDRIVILENKSKPVPPPACTTPRIIALFDRSGSMTRTQHQCHVADAKARKFTHFAFFTRCVEAEYDAKEVDKLSFHFEGPTIFQDVVAYANRMDIREPNTRILIYTDALPQGFCFPHNCSIFFNI